MSEEKQTSLGRGHFLDLVSDYSTLVGEPVGQVTLRMLRWNPQTRPSPPPAPRLPDLAMPGRPQRREHTLTPRDVAVGQHLQPWSIPVTQASIAALATATYDFNDVHLDRDAALRRGARDVYMNILGSSGQANCFLTDWAGPECELHGIRVRLEKQNHPDDRLLLSGEVLAVDGNRITVRVTGRNSLGDRLTADADLELPAGATALSPALDLAKPRRSFNYDQLPPPTLLHVIKHASRHAKRKGEERARRVCGVVIAQAYSAVAPSARRMGGGWTKRR